jgi:hypothetical protein
LHLKLLLLLVVLDLVLEIVQQLLHESPYLVRRQDVWMKVVTVFLKKKLGDFVSVAQEDQTVELDKVDLLFFIAWMSFVVDPDLRRFVNETQF